MHYRIVNGEYQRVVNESARGEMNAEECAVTVLLALARFVLEQDRGMVGRNEFQKGLEEAIKIAETRMALWRVTDDG